MYNTIILKKGTAFLTNKTEMKHFSKGDTIWGNDSYPEEIKRWNVEQKNEAEAELAKYRCYYDNDGETTTIKEYALEYCDCDEESGEFLEGSDFDLAEEEN